MLNRYSSIGIAIRIFLTCWLIYALHFATNTVREIYPAMSLGDHLSFDVSKYLGLHPDIFEIPGRGVFINNNPGASILGAVPYALARPVIDQVVQRINKARIAAGKPAPEYDTIYPMAQEFYRRSYEQGLDIKFGLSAGVMQVFLMAPFSALSTVVMYYVLLYLINSRRKALWLAFLFAFATPVFYRTAQLNHNLLQAHFAFFSFVLLWRPWDDPAHPKKPNYLLAGLLSGWTVVLDYSGLIIITAIGIYAFCRRRSLASLPRSKSDLPIFAFGVAICLMVLMGYQWLAFGSPFYPAQHYMPTTTFSGFGYQGMDLPKLDLLWENAFGMRFGLFISAPLLVLALYLPGWWRYRSDKFDILEKWFIVLFTAAFFAFTAANQFSRMQFNSGVRHMVPVTPFLFLAAAIVLLRLPTWLGIVIGILSTYWSWCLAMYRDVEQGLGIFDSLIQITTGGLRLPWLLTLQRMSIAPPWLDVLPLLVVMALLISGIWIVRSPWQSGINHLDMEMAKAERAGHS
jgi:hypothetical protein